MRKKEIGKEEIGKEESILREYGRALVPDERRKRETLELLKREIENKTIRYKPSFPELFGIQLQYISPAFWAVQGMFLAAVLFVLGRSDLHGGELSGYLWWGSLTAAWMGLAVCVELGRHLSHNIAELEQSCYINLAQMWTMRMILSGGADIVLLGFCCFGIARNTQSAVWQICVYLLVPFVISNLSCLWAVTVLRGGRSRYAYPVLAFLTALLAFIPSLIPKMYEAEYFWIWVAALLFGTVLLAKQLRQCYKRIEKGELLCWS